MDWSALFIALAGAGIALIGVLFAELGQFIRARGSAKAALTARQEDRRAELWQISIPAASRLQAEFADLIGKTSTPPDGPPEEQAPFDVVFPEWWDDKELSLRTDVALIPSAQFRAWIEAVNEGITNSWHLVRVSGYALSQQRAVSKISQLGFEVVSAWLRDERTIETDLLREVENLIASSKDVAEHYEKIDRLTTEANKELGASRDATD